MPHISEYNICPFFHPLPPRCFSYLLSSSIILFTGWRPLTAPSASHCRQQQDSSERQEGLSLLLVWLAWKSGAHHMEAHICARRIHRGGLLCQAERSHDRATVPGESLAKCLSVRQSTHHPACDGPGRGLLHLSLQHASWRAEELHGLPRYLW